MKKFDLEAAKNGASVITRDGRDVEIIRTDIKSTLPVIGLVTFSDDIQRVYQYTEDGKFINGEENDADLFMKPKISNGWVNVYKSQFENWSSLKIYETEDKAKKHIEESNGHKYVATIKIEWEE